jgi:hypothetical protein
MGTRAPAMDRFHALFLMIAGSGLVSAYWICFFLTDWTRPDFTHNLTDPKLVQLTAVYIGFESAFPLPDGFVAITSAISGLYLFARDPKAVLFGLVSGGGLMFLALIDIFFNVLHGFYAPAMLAADMGMQIEVAINVACVSGALWSIWRFWGHPLRRG